LLGLGPASAVERTDERAGVLETVAGPGFCSEAGVVDPSSAAVGALALDGAGRLYFDTGPADEGKVAKVDNDGRVRILATGTPRADPAADVGRVAESGAGRLAADGAGGVFVAAGARVLHVASDTALTYSADAGPAAPPALVSLAGEPGTAPAAYGTGSAGDAGPASAARFTSARSLVTDPAANLYIADQLDGAVLIRFVNRTDQPVTFYTGTPQQLTVKPGHIDTVAGVAASLPPVEGASARSTVFEGSQAAITVTAGLLYVASSAATGLANSSTRIQVVNLGGASATVHGRQVDGGQVTTVSTDDPAQTQRELGTSRLTISGEVSGISADANGNLFLADIETNRVLRLDSNGALSTFAGTGGGELGRGGFNGNNRRATQAQLNQPYDVKAGPDGRIYISDSRNSQVRAVDKSGTIQAVRGSGVALSWRCTSEDGRSTMPPEVPRTGKPSSPAVDQAGNIYVAVPGAAQVDKVDATGIVTAVAGSPRGGFRQCPETQPCPAGGDRGPPREALLVRPTAITLSPDGSLYILDAGDARVRLANLGRRPLLKHGVRVSPGTIETVAGDGRHGFGGDDGPALQAQLAAAGADEGPGGFPGVPGSLALGTEGDLFIADAGNHRIRRVDAAGTMTTIAGEGQPSPRSDCCKDPSDLTSDVAGNLYVRNGPYLWFWNRGALPTTAGGQSVPAGGLKVIAGDGTYGIADDEVRATEAPLLPPAGLTVDSKGNLYIAGVGAFEVGLDIQGIGSVGDLRKVDTAGVVSVVAGNWQAGFNGDGLRAALTSLGAPGGLAVDRCDNVIIADRGNDRLRRVNVFGPCPPLPVVPVPRADRTPVVTLAVAAVTLAVASGIVVLRRRNRTTRRVVT